MQQYSSIILTKERYAAVFVDSLLTFKFRLRKPIILFAFFMVWFIVLFQAMFVCISTPRYRVESSDIRGCPLQLVFSYDRISGPLYSDGATLVWEKRHFPFLFP